MKSSIGSTLAGLVLKAAGEVMRGETLTPEPPNALNRAYNKAMRTKVPQKLGVKDAAQQLLLSKHTPDEGQLWRAMWFAANKGGFKGPGTIEDHLDTALSWGAAPEAERKRIASGDFSDQASRTEHKRVMDRALREDSTFAPAFSKTKAQGSKPIRKAPAPTLEQTIAKDKRSLSKGVKQ